MKRKIALLSRKYRTSLQKYLSASSEDGLAPAASLGFQAAKLGLEILQLARIHEQALLPSFSPGDSRSIRNGVISRGQRFFIEAITPIERTHLASRSAHLRLRKLNHTVSERSNELTRVRKGIKEKVLERRNLEESLKTKDARYGKLLEESRLMQDELRSLTRRVLSGQEIERGKVSRKLHDEVAQSILGIHVRLLMLGQKSSGDFKDLLDEIGKVERLVLDSVRKTQLDCKPRIPTR